MEAGTWTRIRQFDTEFLDQGQGFIQKVQRVMDGVNVETERSFPPPISFGESSPPDLRTVGGDGYGGNLRQFGSI